MTTIAKRPSIPRQCLTRSTALAVAVLALGLVFAAPASASKKTDTLAHGLRPGARKRRSLLQQRAHRRDHRRQRLGHAAVPRPGHPRIQGAAGQELEADRRPHAGIRLARGRQIPQRRGVRRRLGGVHAQLRRRPGEQGRDAAERAVDPEGGEARQVQGAGDQQGAVPRRQGLPGHHARDPSRQVLQGSRPEGHERQAGRLGPLQGRRLPAGQVDHAGKVRRLLQGLAALAAEDRQGP